MTAYTIMNGSILLSSVALHPKSSDWISPGHWKWAWSWALGIIVPLFATAILYAVGSRRLRQRNQTRTAINRWKFMSFWAGWLTLVLALDSPLHKLGEVLFSAH